ncbi:type II secretion system F family protein [Nonomuraea sp. NBC_00507]|uniref:type II secretion system F family protein n=1 Tax=Nonomuraea sp. NBC_00507 TaxID=2976002 RepID=UPI002E198C6C
MNPAVILAGALAGLGVALLAREMLPAPPRLDAALAQLDDITDRISGLPRPQTDGEERTKLARWLTTQLAGRIPVPTRDLDLLRRTPGYFLSQKLLCLLVGLAIPQLLGLIVFLLIPDLSWTFPAVGSLLFGLALSFAPDYVVRAEAARRRKQFRHAIAAYLDLVTLERAAGAAPNQALESAARLSQGWAFTRIASVLDQARRAQTPPWNGLARLADQIGVPELADLADIAELAGNEGARILDTLTAKAESMRAAALSEARAHANSRTTTMVIPIALLGSAFLLLLAFPVAFRLIAP